MRATPDAAGRADRKDRPEASEGAGGRGDPRRARTAAALALLAVLYVTLMPRFAAADLLVGAAAAAAALAAARPLRRSDRPAVPAGPVRGLTTLPGFVLAVAADVAAGAWRVGLVALGLRTEDGRLVEVPRAGRSEGGIAVTGFLATLSPGTVFLAVDEERDALVFHVLGEEAEAFRDRMQRFYRRRQRPLFP